MTGFIGVLMLDTAFERIKGDAGNVDSYHVPAKLCVVKNAGSTDIVRNGKPDPELVAAFCAAAQDLEAQGAIAITSTCGFLVSVQDDIARSVNIPVIVSALTLFGMIRNMHGGRRIGVITASSTQLGEHVLAAANIAPSQIVIAGMEDSAAFANSILVAKAAQCTTIDRQAIEAAVVQKATRLCLTHPDLGAILLECGNLPPYADAIRAATQKPVYSILDAMRLFPLQVSSKRPIS